MYINCDVALSNFKQSSPLYVPLFPHHTWSLCRILWRLEAAPEPGPVWEQLFEHHQLGFVKQVSHHVLTGQVSLSRLDRFFLKLRCYINLWSIKKITLHVPVYLCFMESVNGISKLTSKSSITDNALFEKFKWKKTFPELSGYRPVVWDWSPNPRNTPLRIALSFSEVPHPSEHGWHPIYNRIFNLNPKLTHRFICLQYAESTKHYSKGNKLVFG